MIFFKQVFLFKLIFLCAALVFSPQAHALWITPSTSPQWFGNETSQAQINDAIAPIIGTAVELYKSNVGGVEEGPLAGSYYTQYFPSQTDPSGATIQYSGGDIVDPLAAFLLVKDGDHNPGWYLFNLTALESPWNGTEIIQLYDFWTDEGAISHVTLYGSTGTSQPVPEPASMILFGTGLVVFSFVRRIKKN